MKRGLGSVVGVVLIILISVIAVSIFTAVYLKSVKKSTSDDSALCLGIDLQLKECILFNSTVTTYIVNPYIPSNPITGSALLLNVERFPGGEENEIKDLRFIVKDMLGNEHVYEPVDIFIPAPINWGANTNYSQFVEYDSTDAVIRDLGYDEVKSVSVSAVVGSSQTVCFPTRESIRCKNYLTPNS